MRKTILSLATFASILCAGANASAITDSATVVLNLEGGKTTSYEVKLQKIGENSRRLVIPFNKLGARWSAIKRLDIINPDSVAAKGDKGYWITSDGALDTFRADDAQFILRKNRMPLYGFKKGDEAFVAIMKTLQYAFSTIIDVKNGVYTVFPAFHINEIGMPAYEDIVIDYTYFKGKKANYSSMGKAYRKYQLDRGEVVPLRERAKGNPKLQYTVESPFFKIRMASFMRADETKLNRGYHWKDVDAPNIQKYHSFDEMKVLLKKLKDIGIEKADIILTNWNWRSNGRCPIYGVAEPELGGNAKCRELTKFGRDLGYQIGAHILHTENYTVSPAFDKNDLALQLGGGYIHYDGMGGEAYRPCFKQVYYKQVLENYTNMQLLGFSAPLHIDVTSAITPYPCFDLNHPCTSKDCAFYMNQIGLLSRAFFGGFTSEAGCDHVANTLDYVLYANRWTKEPNGWNSSKELEDCSVPLWQIVYHGIIMSNPFFETLDYWRYGMQNSFDHLKTIEYGARMSGYGSFDKLQPTDDAKLANLKVAYDDYMKLAYLQYEFMEDHRKLADGVFRIRYSDGSIIIVNYNDKPFEYKKKTVQPKSYALFK